MESKKFLTTDEVAAEFGLDAASLKKFVDSGEIRALADRGTWKYRRDELQALLKAGKIQSPPTDPALETLSEDDEELFFPKPSDTVNYMELDEEALADQAPTFDKPNPNPVDDVEQDWFVPSEAAEMAVPPEQSSSDVSIYSEPDGDAESAETVPREQSSSDVTIYSGPSGEAAPSVAGGSDSDVRIASEYETPKPEDSGILLDFNMDAGATVSSSGSSLRLPQTVPGEIQASGVSEDNEDLAWDDASPAAEMGDSSVVGISAGESSIGLGTISDDDGSSLGLGGDSAVQLHDVTGSRVKPRMEESGILLDDGSQVGITGGSSILAGPAGHEPVDSGITVAYVNEDSGITLNSIKEDSGITLEDNRGLDDDDSGISLSAGDSGISLSAGDSGLSLEGADSGLMMESAGDSGIAVDGNARTFADGDLAVSDDMDRTQTLDLAGHFDDDSTFDINLDDGNETSELLLGDDDADETSATVIRKGRPQPGSLSAAFELDDAAEVEDLEISQDLDAGVDEEIEELSDDEEVFDASEETFGDGDEVEATEDEDYLEPAAKAKAAGSREPAWGVDMTIGLIACSLFLAANSLILWGGVSTMWTGADADGPAASLIQTFGELIK